MEPISKSPPARSPKYVPAKSPKLLAKARMNDHRSATGRVGTPKKGGAGGKGAWGRVTDTEGPAVLDRADPNYDSDNEPFYLEEIDMTPPEETLEDLFLGENTKDDSADVNSGKSL